MLTFVSKVFRAFKPLRKYSRMASITVKEEVIEPKCSDPSDKISSTDPKPVSSDLTDPTQVLSKRAIKRLRREEMRKNGKMEPQVKATTLVNDNNKDLIRKDALSETDYYFQNGLRKVYPYYFTFTVYAKGRWLGQTLLDVFTQEFKSTGREYNIHAIESGKLRVNGQSVNVDYKLKHNDFISSITHRHEVPVTADPIEIIANTEDILVVNKPSSIPMHPCGRYRHNSLVYILAKDYNLHNLRPIYRLDRLTSGVTIIARTESKAKELHKLIEGRKVRKEYLCKVEGVFPDERIECKEPLEVLTHSLGLFKVGKNGKESWTTFELVSTDGETSIVRCQPHTGRTHQIRVHLQFLGFPIVNDRIYNSPEWGPNKGKGGDFGRPDEELIEALVDRKVAYLFSTNNQVSYDGESPAKKTKLDSARTSSDFDESKMTHDDMCFECKNDFRDPDPEELVMYLHAYKYGADGWEYSTTVPKWAKCSELENPLDEEKTDASPTVE